MSPAARTVQVFGYYLFAVALGLVFAPDVVLVPLGFAPAVDVWVRVVGLLAAIIGVYYVVAAKHDLRPLLQATVPVRASVIAGFGLLVAAKLAPPALIGFGVVDLAAAIWTARALRATPA